jgi:pyruvate formate lyase activating enzyme
MNLLIKGLQKTSLIDYPPYTSSVIFLGGCNFRCGFCHNPELVLQPDKGNTIKVEEVLEHLKNKRNWIEGVCITGGEPTIYPDLYKFMYELKKQGFLVKLDTNGTNPIILDYLIHNRLVDYIAMDIKAPLEKYEKITGVRADKEAVKQSVEIIKNSGIDYEFRTTAVPGLLGKEDFLRIAEWLKGSKRYCIQQFRNNKGLIDKELEKAEPYDNKKIEEIAKSLNPYFDEVEVKNV